MDASDWQETGAVVRGLVPGEHTVRFKRTRGWLKPSDRTVTIVLQETAVIEGTYRIAQGSGMLNVEISPDEANEADAKWKLDDGEWQDSGAMMPNVDEGDYLVSFKKVSGWLTPDSVSVTVTDEGVEIISGTYYLYGDADGNGKIELADMILIQKIVVGMDAEPSKLETADISQDGVVGMSDSLGILQYLLGMRESLEPTGK